MNAKSIIATVSLLLAAGATYAQGPVEQNEATADIAYTNAAPSAVTRAQVKAETLAAIKAGALEQNEATADIAYQAPRARTPHVDAQLAGKAVKGSSAQ